jgi:hypothetical protein
MQKEIHHRRAKQIQKEKRAAELAQERQRNGGVRAADGENVERLIDDGNGDDPEVLNAGRNEEGMIVPTSMRNYRERTIMMGFARLRRYDRIDLCWGYFKDVERDLLIYNGFVVGFGLFMVLFILLQTNNQRYYGNF